MTEREKWEIFETKSGHDGSYDGVFYIAVKSTKIFCRPSCKARPPLSKNVVFFDTAEECMEAGYRACKRCRPDLIEFSQVLTSEEDAKALIEAYYSDAASLKDKLRKLPVDHSYLNKRFLSKYGKTIAEYTKSVRIENAKEMLKAGYSISEAAFGSGFGSISAFYGNFKNDTEETPGAFRKAIE
ncbi:MAG: methylphosphotriester-DNA--protein-cysteine methyltransferase family protein [Clostridia bacterium]|nr:methylphosphotriester-DNA--protein-cysteine methyltransferase family protein [Clostridia bacterium]